MKIFIKFILPIFFLLPIKAYANYQRIPVSLNGNEVQKICYYDGNTMIAMRPIFEFYGFCVFWNGEQQNIVLNSRDGDLVKHIIGTNQMDINGEVRVFSAPSFLDYDVTYMPLDMLDAMLHFEQCYDKDGTVYINKTFYNNQYNAIITPVLKQISELENYNPLNFQRYIAYLSQNPNLSLDKVILYVNIDVDIPAYTNVKEIQNYMDVFAVVDKTHKLPKGYEPSLAKFDGFWMKPEVGLAWEQMKAAAAKAGINIYINNSYRSEAEQVRLYSPNLEATVARPSFSEHQLGYALDVNNINGMTGTPAGIWLAENGYKYGFILSFQEHKQFITKYAPESWHVRWFPTWAAKIMFEQDLCVAEFENIYVYPKKHGYSVNLQTAKEIAWREF